MRCSGFALSVVLAAVVSAGGRGSVALGNGRGGSRDGHERKAFIYFQHCPRTGGQSFSYWLQATYANSTADIVPTSRPGHMIAETINVAQVS